ncbi:hypothetical protein AB0383_48435 [Amycolatopsis sp. NPDC051373]|uniref:hypothetical protein n=1 Tax=Amycolatopsis sp. NPDC051373 TaxID=3155801 RepID=UPI00344BB570
MSRDDELQHTTAERSIWTGRITALCGATAEAGEYEVIWFAPFGPRCSECKRLAKSDR